MTSLWLSRHGGVVWFPSAVLRNAVWTRPGQLGGDFARLLQWKENRSLKILTRHRMK